MCNKLSDYKGFEGVDASLEISLYEYGLIWKLENEENKGYLFVYGVWTDDSGNYNMFDTAHMSEKEFKDLTEESWFDKKSFDSFRGTTKIHFPDDVHSALQYHGPENIFGSTYNAFEIEED